MFETLQNDAMKQALKQLFCLTDVTIQTTKVDTSDSISLNNNDNNNNCFDNIDGYDANGPITWYIV